MSRFRSVASADPLSQLVGLVVFQPGALLALVVYELMHRAGASVEATLWACGLVLAVTAAIRVVIRRTSLIWKVQRAMVECGLTYVDGSGQVQEPRPLWRGRRWEGKNVTVRWAMPPTVTLRSLAEHHREEIEQRCDVELVAYYDHGQIVTQLYGHRLPDHVLFDDLHREPFPSGRLVVPIGKGRRGNVYADFESVRHLLICGETGSGKSVALRSLITSLALRYEPDQLRFAFIDMKALELAHFAELPHTAAPIADDLNSTLQLLTNVRAEMTRRMQLVRRHRLTSVDALNDTQRLPFVPRIIVIVDELAELSVADQGGDKAARDAQRAAMSRLAEIGRIGRALSVHLICSLQRGDADALPGALKTNLPATLAYRARDAINSRIALSTDQAAFLPPMHPGRGLWAAGERVEEVQTPYVSDADARAMLAQRYGLRDEGPDCVSRAPENTSQSDSGLWL